MPWPRRRAGFGRDLRRILTSFVGAEQEQELATWRIALTAELRSNSAGSLDKRHPKLADAFPGNFPDLDVVELYMDPLTSWSSRFTGTPPVTSLWTPAEPDVYQLSAFCAAHFGWQGDIQNRFKANLWPGVAFQMISSRYIIYDETRKRLATPYTNGTLQKIVSSGVIKDSTLVEPLELFRVRISITNFIQKAGLHFEGGKDYVLVTVPLSILAVATRDLTLASTNMRDVPSIGSIQTAQLDTEKENLDAVPDTINALDGATSQSTSDGNVAMGHMVRAEARESQLVEAHRRLAARGVIDLTHTGQGS
ncbi:hypothetical protein B0H11DRAFT_2239119 [Mycena galericulata]|nr:hypothetical protein B0H11DRAFT_2239119 [Mycena galericulata]